MKEEKTISNFWRQYFLSCSASPFIFSLLIGLILALIFKLVILVSDNLNPNDIMNYLDAGSLLLSGCTVILHYMLVILVIKTKISVPLGYSLFGPQDIFCFSFDSKHEKLIEFSSPTWHKGKVLTIKKPGLTSEQGIISKKFFAETNLKHQDFNVVIKLPVLLKFEININKLDVTKILESDFKGGYIEDYFIQNFHKMQNKKAVVEMMNKIRDKLLANSSTCLHTIKFDQDFIDSLKKFIKFPESDDDFLNIAMNIKAPLVEQPCNFEVK